jgi:hypothetical protein
MKKVLVAVIIGLLFLVACGSSEVDMDEIAGAVTTEAPIRDKPYSAAIEARVAAANTEVIFDQNRPDYLPAGMYGNLPAFPKDFYSIRVLLRSGRLTDLSELEEGYWMQPEFFPQYEEIGLPLLQNPPVGRWGAYGLASYPAQSIATINAGDTLDFFFFMKSNYIVETYQGVQLDVKYPHFAEITTGATMPDGSARVDQDPQVTKELFDVEVSPETFVLEPNFPIFRKEGIRKVKVTVTAKPNTPPGNYVIAVDTGAVPEEAEKVWIQKYLNLYTSGALTKIDKPYYTALITVQ